MKPIPQKIEEGGFDPKLRRKVNDIIEALRSMSPLSTPSVEVEKTTNGFFIRSKGGNDNNNNNAPRWG